MGFLRSGGLFGNLLRGIGQKFGWGKTYDEPTEDLSDFNKLTLGGVDPFANLDIRDKFDRRLSDPLTTNVISDYPQYRTPNLGGTDQYPITSYADQIKNFLAIPRVTAGEDEFIDWTQGAKDGGRIGYRNGEFVDEDINVEGPGFDVNENIEMASAPHPDEAWIGLWENLSEQGMVPIEIETLEDFKNWFHNQDFDMGSMSEEGIASIV